jgi:hypothetical protein
MNSAYLNIKDITSLQEVLTYLQSIEDPNDVAIFLDWDDSLVNPDYDNIIEPEITKKLFDYMQNKGIFFAIITGRFYDTVCDDTKRNIFDMQHNIIHTMFPSLKKLGVNVDRQQTSEFKNTIYKIYNESGICVGVLYMGIFFTGKKGETIKNYLRQTGIKKNIILFVDDYEPYLIETTSSLPNIIAYRRLKPNIV